jgi:hypothetical protein
MADTSVTVTYSTNRLTLLDIAKKNGADGVVGLVNETIRNTPEVLIGAARTIKGLNYKTLIRTGLGSVGFRDYNTGSGVVKSTYRNQNIECFLLNPRIEVDKAVADADEDGAEAYIAMEGKAVMDASLQLLGRTFYYGRNTTYGGDSKGNPGLLDYIDPGLIYDAGGTSTTTNGTTNATTTVTTISTTAALFAGQHVTGTGIPTGTYIASVDSTTQITLTNAATNSTTVSLTCDGSSSAYFVAFGTQEVQWVFGNDGQLAMAPTRVGDIITPDGGHVTGYISELEARPGLQVLNRYSIIRIKNLTGQAGKGLTDAVLGKALSLLPASFRYRITDLFISPRSAEQWRASRTAVNTTGAEAPTPTYFEGVPARITDSLSNIEASAL